MRFGRSDVECGRAVKRQNHRLTIPHRQCTIRALKGKNSEAENKTSYRVSLPPLPQVVEAVER